MSMLSVRPLLRVITPGLAPSDDDACPREAAFMRLPSASLTLAVDGQAGRALLLHLGHLVRRSRGDLLSHARRVLLAHRLGDGATSCAAMVDLACVLDDKGQALRQSLFEQIAPSLDSGCQARLATLLTRAPRAAECEATPGTLLRPTVTPAALVKRRLSAVDGR